VEEWGETDIHQGEHSGAVEGCDPDSFLALKAGEEAKTIEEDAVCKGRAEEADGSERLGEVGGERLGGDDEGDG
jgi:hypothetical protein